MSAPVVWQRAGTKDSLLGKLKAIVNELGRLDASNPVAHPRVKENLKRAGESRDYYHASGSLVFHQVSETHSLS